MKRLRLSLTFGLALACVLTQAQAPRVTVISGATLIDGTTRPPIQDAVIVIDGAKISQAGPRAAVAAPPGATVIDGQGKFVIPGLADMHHHLLSGSMRPVVNMRLVLRRMLALGVTTVFTPSTSLQDFAALKAAAAEDSAPFARFFGTGPPITMKGDPFAGPIGAPVPETPEQAQAAVRDLKAAGVHAVKIQRDDSSWMTKN